jgi:hypothetical protein
MTVADLDVWFWLRGEEAPPNPLRIAGRFSLHSLQSVLLGR